MPGTERKSFRTTVTLTTESCRNARRDGATGVFIAFTGSVGSVEQIEPAKHAFNRYVNCMGETGKYVL